jgi:hypothetical protein
MPKLTQAEIKAKLDDWAKADQKIQKATQAMNAALEPLERKHALAIQPVLDEHDAKIQKLADQKRKIETEVIDWLKTQNKPLVVEGNLATAANETKVGSRVIDVQKFFDAVKEKNASFWDCVSVAIAKAEKLVGKTKVDEISTKDSKLVPSIKLK